MERITKKLSREFRHNRLALFDELNVTGIRKHIKKLYEKAFEIIKTDFVEVLNDIAAEVYDEAVALGFDGNIEDLDNAWIEEFFDEYNPVTKYVFSNEIGRKESYLFEAIVADTVLRHQSYLKAERLLANQVKQGGIDMDDAVAKTVYKAVGVKRVQWIAEDDAKTCSVCRELDKQIFDLDKAPHKPHHNCRCYLLPVREMK